MSGEALSEHSTPHPDTQPLTVIEPSRGWVNLEFGKLWTFRELVYFFTWRDVMVRYKQTVLGAAWAILQPFLTMLVFTLFFGRLAKMPSDGVPYPLFAYAALLPWQLFAFSLSQASNSLVASQNLIKKVYFPRLAIPISSVLAGLVDFVLAFIVLVGMMAWYRFVPTANIIFLPLFLVLALASALTVGLWLSALNVQYRDIKYTLPFLTQFWLFATPIAYPSSLVPEQWRTLYGLNPMAGVVEGFRWALFGKTEMAFGLVMMSTVIVALSLFCGLIYFRRMERTFADVV